MPRCVTPVVAFSFAVLAALPAATQVPTVQRPMPPNALRGELVVTQPPAVMLNGKADRLAPGARIRGQDNLIVLSGRLAGDKLVVNYTRELSGQLHEVWILTPAERAKLWPKTPQEAAAWRFDRLSQTWKKSS